MRKVEDINDLRRDLPEQEQIRRVANGAYARAATAKTRSILTIEVVNGRGVICGLVIDDADKGDVLLALERLKRVLIED